MKANINSIISFILIPISFTIFMLFLALDYSWIKLDFLDLYSAYQIKIIIIDILFYLGLTIPSLLLLTSIWFGFKHRRLGTSNKGYRFLNLISVALSICGLIMLNIGYFII
jgi:hypothetical protein